MKEYFILSDIHSFYNEMMQALQKEGFDTNNRNHIVIVCGDLLDRGPDSKKVVDFFYDLYKQNRCILIRGNHEDLFDRMVITRRYGSHDFHNGTLKTLGQLQEKPLAEETTALLFDECISGYDKHWDELKDSMLNYYELGKYVLEIIQ